MSLQYLKKAAKTPEAESNHKYFPGEKFDRGAPVKS
jgi:hypothetical protein